MWNLAWGWWSGKASCRSGHLGWGLEGKDKKERHWEGVRRGSCFRPKNGGERGSGVGPGVNGRVGEH